MGEFVRIYMMLLVTAVMLSMGCLALPIKLGLAETSAFHTVTNIKCQKEYIHFGGKCREIRQPAISGAKVNQTQSTFPAPELLNSNTKEKLATSKTETNETMPNVTGPETSNNSSIIFDKN